MPKRAFSGIQPSGSLHIGNYLGAITQFVEVQKDHELISCVVDEHAITVPQEPVELRTHTLDITAAYLAAGIDPEKTIIFVQSHVPAHAELGWILNTMTPIGELERMTQYKEKRESAKGVYAGLFNYPTLMAADILLYRADVVPVGEDQVQHIELTRSLAERFNNRFGETFKIPEARVKKETARIASLSNPLKKMSKSDESDKGYILLQDAPDRIREKIKAAVTDSGSDMRFDPAEKPAISNLLAIFSEFAGKPIAALERDYAGKSYAAFKDDLAETIIQGLAPFQTRFSELKENPDKLRKILSGGSERAGKIAYATLSDVKQKIGFLIQDPHYLLRKNMNL